MTRETYKGIMDSTMTAAGMAAAVCGIVLEVLCGFAVDSTGAIPAATIYAVRIAWHGLLWSGSALGILVAVRLAVWLRFRRRGVRLGTMTPEEICAACRRMR